MDPTSSDMMLMAESCDADGETMNSALFAIAAGLFACAEKISYAARELGNGGAATPMGAMEALGKVHKEGLSEIASAIASIDLSQAI